MLRQMCVFVVLAVLGAAPALAMAGIPPGNLPLQGPPPYTDAEVIAAIRAYDASEDQRDDIERWWSRAPAPLRARLLNTRPEGWVPVVLCNFLGFQQGDRAVAGIERCEAQYLAQIREEGTRWSREGVYQGPSDACRARNKRNQYGVLVCDGG